MEKEHQVAPGRVIDGKYELGRVIGSGGMGTVYEATQVGLHRKVALKILRGELSRSPKIVTRFQQEARLAGSIEHDNICRVTDHGTDENGAPYLVMPLLNGRSLAKMLEDKDPLSQMRMVDIACQTLMALEAAHREKIVHRDLKPDNIFVTQMGDREDFVKLLDFGISKVLEKESVSEMTLTSTGMILGTAFYLAPEQAKGAKRIDHRVDIYAMGVILYEALTGKRPFEGETYNEVLFKIAGEPFKPPRALNEKISPAVEKVILRAMSIDPAARFESASAMCSALEEAMVNASGSAGLATADTLANTAIEQRARMGKGSRGRWLLLGGGALLLAIALGWFALVGRVDRSETVDSPSPAPSAAAATAHGEKPERAASLPESPVAPTQVPVPHVAEQASEVPSPEMPEEGGSAKHPDTAAFQKGGVSKGEHAKRSSREPALSTVKKNPKKPRKKDPEGKKVIKGQFGTTFVFEEE